MGQRLFALADDVVVAGAALERTQLHFAEPRDLDELVLRRSLVFFLIFDHDWIGDIVAALLLLENEGACDIGHPALDDALTVFLGVLDHEKLVQLHIEFGAPVVLADSSHAMILPVICPSVNPLLLFLVQSRCRAPMRMITAKRLTKHLFILKVFIWTIFLELLQL